MSGAIPFRPYTETRFASRERKRAVSAQPSPRQNRILAALPPADYERLLPHLEFVPLPVGSAVHRHCSQHKHIYFLGAGIVSRVCVTESGASSECAVTGREGVVGVVSFLGGGCTPCQAKVVSPGYAYRLEADLFKAECERGGALPHLLLLYTQVLITQTGQIAVCNRHHTLQQQLCRWILSSLDRLSSNEITMTHETIASLLGVRREGVTEAAGHLQAAGLIRYGRGHITVLDRPQLEARVCECYAVVKREYERLFPEYAQTSLLGAAPATFASIGATAFSNAS